MIPQIEPRPDEQSLSNGLVDRKGNGQVTVSRRRAGANLDRGARRWRCLLWEPFMHIQTGDRMPTRKTAWGAKSEKMTIHGNQASSRGKS